MKSVRRRAVGWRSADAKRIVCKDRVVRICGKAHASGVGLLREYPRPRRGLWGALGRCFSVGIALHRYEFLREVGRLAQHLLLELGGLDRVGEQVALGVAAVEGLEHHQFID